MPSKSRIGIENTRTNRFGLALKLADIDEQIRESEKIESMLMQEFQSSHMEKWIDNHSKR